MNASIGQATMGNARASSTDMVVSKVPLNGTLAAAALPVCAPLVFSSSITLA